MNTNNLTAEIKQRLDRIDELAQLQQEREPNDIRRSLIEKEIKGIERLTVELRRRNQQ